MPDLRPSTKEEFVEEFLAYRPASSGEEGETIREKIRREKKTKKELAEMVTLFEKQFKTPPTELSIASDLDEVSSTSSDQAYSPWQVSNGLSPAFIQEVRHQAGMNVIRKNPLNTWTAAGIVAASTFTMPLIAFVIFEAVTGATAMSAILPFLPFLAALTPVGAALAFAGMIAAASLIIFAITVGITAGATHKNIEFEEEDVAPSSVNASMRDLMKMEAARPSASPDNGADFIAVLASPPVFAAPDLNAASAAAAVQDYGNNL
jgi:hypothetical protein